MNAEQVVLAQIEGLERQLTDARTILQAIRECRGSLGDEYVSIFKALHATETYLDKTGRPASRETIARSLEDGGWGKKRVKRPYWNLLSILEYHLGSSFKSERRFKEVNGLVGRIEWPDEAFAEEGVNEKERPAPKD